ncbi:hypothetical protein [Streptacidiphilus anmyonensis]|uniref:hypothetical protein n=1 Tax=Streptacidiphilus anmyonensis TaxID=405782 RepID=UPI0005A79ED0|nr:hypothetical protein [Streptacidiphilus anmyonensis]
MYSEPDPATAQRMRKAHANAARTFRARVLGEGESWGWRGRTLSRRVTTEDGERWLRLVSAPADKAGGKLWEGPTEAELAMPASVPRPRLRASSAWTDDKDAYLAELYDVVADTTITTDSPVLRSAPRLSGEWWVGLMIALGAVRDVHTARVALRQEYLERAMPEYLGFMPGQDGVVWAAAHGDLHWANLTAPGLHILDWEGWGMAPAGYDAAMLHTYSLLVPDVAADVRHHLSDQLDTPSGRFAELAVITQLLQTNRRGDNLDLAEPLRARLAILREAEDVALG